MENWSYKGIFDIVFFPFFPISRAVKLKHNFFVFNIALNIRVYSFIYIYIYITNTFNSLRIESNIFYLD